MWATAGAAEALMEVMERRVKDKIVIEP